MRDVREAAIDSRQLGFTTLWIVTGIVLLTSGCTPERSNTPHDDARIVLDATTREELRLRAVSGLARGWLSKPAEASSDVSGFALAPLVIHGLAEGEAAPGRPLGRASMDEAGRLVVDPNQPTLYTAENQARIGDRDFAQRSYTWWTVSPDGTGPTRQGFRMTLNAEGSPFLWEILSDTTGGRLLFVDRALEEAALEEFGPPLPTQQHALEQPSTGVAPVSDVVLVRLIEAGNTPLGPFVYLTEEGIDVQTLLCRCMGSEVSDIPGLGEYELRPLDELTRQGIDTTWGTPPEAIGTLLRFPSSL